MNGITLQLALFFFILPQGWSAPGRGWVQQEEHHSMSHQTPASAASAVDTASVDTTKEEADKRFSEFNHRFSGVFILLLGLLAFLEPTLGKRIGFLRYLWAVFFFVPGLYLFFFSDPESWPFGSQTLHYVITQNMQVLQHKVFSLVLLGLSIVEFLRVRNRVPVLWTATLFPAVAGIGAFLLFYHSPQSHAGGMSGAAHTAMQKIYHQHVGFAIVGLGAIVTKAVADLGRFRVRLLRSLSAIFLVLLGILLVTYTE